MLTPEERAEFDLLKQAVRQLQQDEIPQRPDFSKLTTPGPDGTVPHMRCEGADNDSNMFGKLPVPQTPDTAVPPPPASVIAAMTGNSFGHPTVDPSIVPLKPGEFA